MSQYVKGTVSVTNNSNAVVGVGTLWLTNVAVGSVFMLPGSNVPYVVGAVPDDTHLTLSSLYAGTTGSGLSYAITTSFTPNLGLPYPEPKDIDTATIVKRAMLLIDQIVATPGVTINGTSATSLTPAGGAVTLTTQTGKQFAYPQYLLIASAANPANFMAGQVTSYNAVSGSLVMNITIFGGSGAHTDWAISLSGMAGKSINWTGQWSAATAYILGDAVFENGSSYVCSASNTNQVPPNVAYWSPLDLGWYNRGNWATATLYNVNDVVKDAAGGQNVYICLSVHTSGTLATDISGGKWSVLVDAAAATAAAATATAQAAAASASAGAAATSESNAAASAAIAVAAANSMPTAAAGGTADAITATFSPAITLADQTIVAVVCTGANATTTPTFAPNGLTAHTITTRGGAAMAAGDIPGAGFVALLEYNLANTRWEMLNPAGWATKGFVTGEFGKHGNIALNPRFNIWQVGTSISVGAGFAYGPDGWYGFRAGSVAGETLSQVTASSVTSKFGCKVQRDGGNASTASVIVSQPFETLKIVPLRGSNVTVSFKAKAGANFSASGSVIMVGLATGTGAEGKYNVTGFTGATTPINNVLQGITTTLTQYSFTSSAIPTNATQMEIYILFTPVGTAGADDSFTIEEFKIDIGNVATALPPDDPALELIECQRHFEICGSGSAGKAVSATGMQGSFIFKVPKRIAPTMSLFAQGSIVEYGVATRAGSGGTLLVNGAPAPTGGGYFDLSGFSSMTAGNFVSIMNDPFAASARL